LTLTIISVNVIKDNKDEVIMNKWNIDEFVEVLNKEIPLREMNDINS